MGDLDVHDCDLDDAKAKAMKEPLARFQGLQKVNFSENRALSAEGWVMLLLALSSTVEDLDFRDCDFDDAKAKAMKEPLARFQGLKKVNFEGNRNRALSA